MGSATLALGLCGCGGMGRRHILGLRKLRGIGRLPGDLIAVCDPDPTNADRAAALAAELLGRRPRVFNDVAALRHAVPELDAVTVATAPDLHLSLGLAALEAGLHVLMEKPIALTVRQGQQLVEAARARQRRLAVAENYRRDPLNRLAKAITDAGGVGQPFLAIQSSSGSGESLIISAWRHRRQSGGIIMDMGVHYADLLEYYLGPVESVVGMNAVVDRERRDDRGAVHVADAEDLSVGVARFRSGALANWVLSLAGRGAGHFSRLIYGTGGSLSIPADRTGRPLQLVRRDASRDMTVDERDQLALVPAFVLDDTTAALFGGDRLTSYDLAWADIDANLLAIEQDDFMQAILQGRDPEVTGADGVRSLALVYAFLESERLGRIVGIDEMLGGAAMPYQSEIASADRAVTNAKG